MAYFTTLEFRAAMPDMDDEPKYPDATVELARDAVEALIEEVCGTSFVTRTVTETRSGVDGYGVLLSRPFVLSVTSVTIDGALSTGYTYTAAGGLLHRFATGSYSPTAWVCGTDNISVVYEAGYSSAPPSDLKLAAMLATRDRVLSLTAAAGKPSSRMTSMTNEVGGTMTFAVAAPDRPTGNPDVDATIMRWASKVRVFGFA